MTPETSHSDLLPFPAHAVLELILAKNSLKSENEFSAEARRLYEYILPQPIRDSRDIAESVKIAVALDAVRLENPGITEIEQSLGRINRYVIDCINPSVLSKRAELWIETQQGHLPGDYRPSVRPLDVNTFHTLCRNIPKEPESREPAPHLSNLDPLDYALLPQKRGDDGANNSVRALYSYAKVYGFIEDTSQFCWADKKNGVLEISISPERACDLANKINEIAAGSCHVSEGSVFVNMEKLEEAGIFFHAQIMLERINQAIEHPSGRA